MLVIPAIDLKDGKCVRLRQGRMEDNTIYADDPVAMAGHWAEAGARRLHIIDLNGAFAGTPINGEIIRRIADTLPNLQTDGHPIADLPIQVGGGIRDEKTIQAYLDAGVSYVILGTQAINTPHFVAAMCTTFPGHIMVGLDAKDGKVATDGWSKLSQHDVIDMAQRFENDGVEAIIYTDIGRDGMMTGVNIEATVALARAIHIPVIASGGIVNLDDIRALCAVTDEGIMGAITGRALYEGSLKFAEAQQLADELTAGGQL